MKTFKDRQIEIYQAEQKLADNTQKLLFDLLTNLIANGKQDKLKDFSLDEFDCIVEVVDAETILISDGIEESTRILDHISQREQKNIIDEIILNIQLES